MCDEALAALYARRPLRLRTHTLTYTHQDVQQALTANDLGPLNAIPWAVMLGNTLGWVSYGLLRHNWFIFFANAPGFVLSIYFNATAVKLLHYAAATTTSPASSGRLVGGGSSAPTAPLTRSADAAVPGSVVVVVKAPMSEPTEGSTDSPLPAAEPPLASMVVMPVVAPTTNSSLPLPPRNIYQQRLQTQERLVLAMVLVWMAVLTAVIAVQSWDDDTRQLVTGLTVNANLVFFYGAPLSTIRHVWRTRSSASLHGPTVVRNTLNGVFWMI
jgi:solute carrier family 50 protein (sugar transporter)